MSRRTVRKGVFKALYTRIFLEEPDFNNTVEEAFSEDAILWFDQDDTDISLFTDINENDKVFFTDLIKGVTENIDRINEIIEENLKSWKMNRIAKTDLAILQLAVYEIFYRDDVPDSVAINEAVELGKEYGTDDSGSFINGVLGKVVRDFKPES